MARYLTTFCFLMSLATGLMAQAQPETLPIEAPGSTPSPVAPVKSSLGEDPGPIYTQMIRQWMEITNFAKQSSEIVTGTLIEDIKKNHKLKDAVGPEMIADLKQYFYELFISDEMAKNIAIVYSQYFTLDEMVELINLYKTPIAQKLVKVNPDIAIRSQQIGMNMLKAHEAGYMKIIAKYKKKA